jgi:hypothetical protein
MAFLAAWPSSAIVIAAGDLFEEAASGFSSERPLDLSADGFSQTDLQTNWLAGRARRVEPNSDPLAKGLEQLLGKSGPRQL